MTWWMWIVLWAALVLAALAVIGLLGWKVIKSGMALMDELDSTSETLSGISDRVEEIADTRTFQPAIFADPAMLRAEREHRAREKKRAEHVRSAAPVGMTGPSSSRTMGTDV